MLKSSAPGMLLLGSNVLVCAGHAADVVPVVVTANRMAQTADQTLASVTVITREDIERRQPRSVPDALRGTPGLHIANSGGPGKSTSVFLRGTESDHVLVLIDGVKIGSATLGTAPWHDLPVDQIERIEVVRGPRSSLYGSEAIGGVIQIFTRKGHGPTKSRFSLGAGTYDTAQASAGLAGGDRRSWYNFSASGLSTDGFNACRGMPGVGGCFIDEPDTDGYRNHSGLLRAGYRFDNGWELDAHWSRTEAETRFDGSFQNESETMQQVIGGSARYSPDADWRFEFIAGRSWDKSDNFKDGVFVSRFDSIRDTIAAQNFITLSESRILTVGFDYQNDRVESAARFTETERANRAVFAQLQQYLNRHSFEASVRHDRNSQFGDHSTGSIAWGYELGPTWRSVLSYGTAFKAPTFNELYYPGFGNPHLRPEQSRTLEWSLRGKPGWGSWSATVFRTEVDRLIAFDADTFAPANIGTADITGLEATVTTHLSGWRLQSMATLLDAENRSGGENRGNQLPRRAAAAWRLDADRDFGPYGLGATLFAQSRHYDDLANTRALDGYATLDLRAEYRFAKHWRLQGRLRNLFDRDYETAAFYNQPGRSVFLILRYAP